MAEFVGGLDQGTTSTRFVVFDLAGDEVGRHQLEHRQLFARPGWVEHDAMEIFERATTVIEVALERSSVQAGDLVGIGIANQRETTVVWNRRTGVPVAPAIVWQDTRNERAVAALIAAGRTAEIRQRTGLPVTTYPCATKLRWILDEVAGARAQAERGELAFGTIDSWLVWKMTGQHVTDVTNASRTMLMDLETLDWDDDLLELFDIPRSVLPTIGSSTWTPGELVVRGVGRAIDGAEITALLGDQQAALVGQGCFAPGEAKNTYGTGNFLLVNTGTEIVRSAHGLISTVAYRFGTDPAVYALEGAIAVTGAAVQWLRDQLGVIEHANEIEALAMTVDDSEGLYFVPAFSGLFAPFWRPDARGIIAGMTRAHTKGHLARATLEAVAFQCRDVLGAIEADFGRTIPELRVDGGMTVNALCMQLQADILGVPIIRAPYLETTVRGAALAAGLGAGLWRDVVDLPAMTVSNGRRWEPTWSPERHAARSRGWRRALEHSLGWVDDLSP